MRRGMRGVGLLLTVVAAVVATIALTACFELDPRPDAGTERGTAIITGTIALDAYFVYPEELKSVARVQVFRDFLVAKAQRWHF